MWIGKAKSLLLNSELFEWIQTESRNTLELGFDGRSDLGPSAVTFCICLYRLPTEVVLQRRCDRNRKRSKRRAIYCPIHGCYLDSVSQKHALYADRADQLQQRGMNRRHALMLVASQTAVPLEGEWLEAFWCPECEETKWYHIRKRDCEGRSLYEVMPAPRELWQQATGLIHPHGNPSVGEFTKRQSRLITFQGIKDFRFVT